MGKKNKRKQGIEPIQGPARTSQPSKALNTASQTNVTGQPFPMEGIRNHRINQVATSAPVSNGVASATSDSECEFELLDPIGPASLSTKPSSGQEHDHTTAPLMTRGALMGSGLEGSLQYGVLGQVISVNTRERADTPEDTRLYLNTNAPLSALVCGVQGSGKSHTVSAMLESMFIPGDRRIGALQKPLCGLVLHMSDGGPHSCPNEAAWIGIPKDASTRVPKVKVFVSPSSINTMKAVYKPFGTNVTVQPLYFREDELDAQAFLSMMAVGSSETAPLYIQVLMSLLWELGENYTYQAFKVKLNEKRKGFNPAQQNGLKQRLALLESFMSKDKYRATTEQRFEEGQLTIIDLSDPFIDPASVCSLFEVVTRLFVRARVDTGKVILVDEAHKYLSTENGASGLTKALLTLIREQRHKGMRVIISTQEPTVVPPVLIDLCTVTILHRFSSPSWWEHVIKHVSADVSVGAFDLIVKLKTGEAIVLAPTGLCIFGTGTPSERVIGQYGRRYLHLRVRRRITEDGGGSILVI